MALEDRPVEERAALAYCAPRGIPLSVFLGRTVYPGEPAWLSDDRVAALDWLSDELGRCDGCGQRLSETTGEGTYDTWNAELDGHCDACRARTRTALQVANSDDPVPETTGARYRLWQDQED